MGSRLLDDVIKFEALSFNSFLFPGDPISQKTFLPPSGYSKTTILWVLRKSWPEGTMLGNWTLCYIVIRSFFFFKIKSKPLLNIPPSNHLHLNLYPCPDFRTGRAVHVSLSPAGSDPVGSHNAEKPRQDTPHGADLHGSVPPQDLGRGWQHWPWNQSSSTGGQEAEVGASLFQT